MGVSKTGSECWLLLAGMLDSVLGSELAVSGLGLWSQVFRCPLCGAGFLERRVAQ